MGAIEDPVPVEVAAEEAAIESSDEDQIPVETPTDDGSEGMTSKTMEDPAPVEVAPEEVAKEESASSSEDQTPVETPTADDSEGMTAIIAIEDPMPEEVAAIVDLRRSPLSEDQTPVEIVMTSEAAIPEGMTAIEAI